MPAPPLRLPPADDEVYSESGSSEPFLSIPAKCEIEDAVVEVELALALLAFMLFDLDRALSSLLPSFPDFAERFPMPILSCGNFRLPSNFASCGTL